jgi:deoxycytidine triphosphate deaminase
MGVLPDWQIQRDVVIEPFAPGQSRPGVISYGVTSYGYDVRVGRHFKVFTNAHCAVVDPKNFDTASFVDIEGDSCLIPPNSFALAETVEYLEIPRDVLGICVGKCLTGDTRVVDAATGDYLPIRDFVAQRRKETVALHGLRLGQAAVTDHRPSGFEPVYHLVTGTGMELTATANHPLRAWDGWTPLSELRAGDRVAVARSCAVFGKTEWPEHEATLLGLLLADGQCRTPGSSPRYTSADPRLVEVLHEATRAFGCEVSPVGNLGYNLVNRRGRGGIVTRNRVYSWLDSLGCAVKSIDKGVPGVVFRAPRERVASFLRAIFSGDGSSYTSTSKKGTLGVTLEYSSTSERLIRDVRHLLLRFGVFSLVRGRMSASGRRAYRIQISDLDVLRRFAAVIGFVPGSRKQQTFQALLAQLGDRPKARSNFDTLPVRAGEVLKAAAQQGGRSLLSMGVHLGAGQSVPYKFARAVADATGDPAASARNEADVVWDTVRSIRPAGTEAVYDLSVPGAHSFLANDIPVHNSTYARCGIIVNVTPLEPEWRGRITIEISNTTPLPAKIYAGEGIAQIVFLRAEAECRTSYADKKGKYQDQKGLTLPFVIGPGPGPTEQGRTSGKWEFFCVQPSTHQVESLTTSHLRVPPPRPPARGGGHAGSILPR